MRCDSIISMKMQKECDLLAFQDKVFFFSFFLHCFMNKLVVLLSLLEETSFDCQCVCCAFQRVIFSQLVSQSVSHSVRQAVRRVSLSLCLSVCISLSIYLSISFSLSFFFSPLITLLPFIISSLHIISLPFLSFPPPPSYPFPSLPSPTHFHLILPLPLLLLIPPSPASPPSHPSLLCPSRLSSHFHSQHLLTCVLGPSTGG